MIKVETVYCDVFQDMLVIKLVFLYLEFASVLQYCIRGLRLPSVSVTHGTSPLLSYRPQLYALQMLHAISLQMP